MKVKVDRTNHGGTCYQSVYDINVEPGSTVLEILDTIFRNNEPTLSFRYSCRIGICGTCTVMTNGKPGLSCLKIANPDLEGCLHIGPMPRGRTIADLVKE